MTDFDRHEPGRPLEGGRRELRDLPRVLIPPLQLRWRGWLVKGGCLRRAAWREVAINHRLRLREGDRPRRACPPLPYR